ncbi:hypothetical protein M5689_011596 [Euphorbia peplus]|nr:hypothetical protein M5689_011596 [Euphorbia peplus]
MRASLGPMVLIRRKEGVKVKPEDEKKKKKTT